MCNSAAIPLLQTLFLTALFLLSCPKSRPSEARLLGTFDGAGEEFFPRFAGLRWIARSQK
jgi:hypothetical protein